MSVALSTFLENGDKGTIKCLYLLQGFAKLFYMVSIKIIALIIKISLNFPGLDVESRCGISKRKKYEALDPPSKETQINQEYYICQNCPSKMKRRLRLSQINKS